MSYEFLIWFYLFGIFVAVLQDIKRREVDDWLNLFLFFGGVLILVFLAIPLGGFWDFFWLFAVIFFCVSFLFLEGEPVLARFLNKDLVGVFAALFSIFISLGVAYSEGSDSLRPLTVLSSLILLVFSVSCFFYYGRIFAGGDAKLLFSLSPLFYSGDFFNSYYSFGVFSFFLLISGAAYGLFYSAYLYFKNHKKVNAFIKKDSKRNILLFVLFFSLFVIALFFEPYAAAFFAILSFIPWIYSVVRAIDSLCMVKRIPSSMLSEGDWLARPVKTKGRVISPSWDGVSKEEIGIIGKKRRVWVREGIPFTPAFLIAILFYVARVLV